MAILPSSDVEKLEFVETHIAAWTANAVAIGMTAAQVTAIDNAAKAARLAFNAALTARNASKGATQTFLNSVGAMTDLARTAITNIKNKAESAHDPSVYTLAQIPPPATPTPVGQPDAPTNVTADPNADGTVTIRWKGSVANQTFFTVWRRSPGAAANAEWTSLGATAFKKKSFIDATVPSGVASVEYRVTAQRQNFISEPSATVTVNFGGGQSLTDTAGFVGPENSSNAEAA